MIEFIISILVPILGGLGVSEADVTTYVTNCSGYIYAILISILVLIVLLVAAHFIAPKGKRHLVRWGASLAWVLALVTMVNMVCYGPLYTNLSVVLNGGGTVSDEAKAASNEVIKKVGEEGMVLVKNNGLLPLSSDVNSMNVFGWASTNPIYGGTGSGSADTSSVVSILQSLSDAGYKTNESLTKMYTDYRADRPAATILGGDGSFDITLPEPTADYYTDDVMGEAESFSDVAMVVISRGGGEGYDLPTDMNSVIHGTYNVADEVSVNPANYAYTNISYTNNGDYDDFDAGESYLELSNTEEAMLDKVCSEFSKVIVVINANNPMELDWVDNYDSIGAVILAPGTGHPLSRKEALQAADFADYQVLGYNRHSGLGKYTRSFFKEHGIAPNFICESPDENGIASLVAQGFGIALVADVDTIYRDEICIRPLISSESFSHTVYMGYMRGKYQLPAVQRFIAFVRNVQA